MNAEQMARMKYEKKEEYIPTIIWKGKTYEELEKEANAKLEKKREYAKEYGKKYREEKRKGKEKKEDKKDKENLECDKESKAKKAREYGIKWRKDNPDKVKMYNKKQTQRDAAHRDKQRSIEYKSQRASCPFCGYSGCNCGSGY